MCCVCMEKKIGGKEEFHESSRRQKERDKREGKMYKKNEKCEFRNKSWERQQGRTCEHNIAFFCNKPVYP